MNKKAQSQENSELMERLLAINERMGKLIFYELMVNAAEQLEEGEEELDELECDDCDDCDETGECEEGEDELEFEEHDEDEEGEEEPEPTTLEEVVDAIETRLEYLENIAGAQFDFELCEEDEDEEENDEEDEKK